MPYTQTYPLGGNGDVLQDLLRRIEILEARTRQIQAGALTFVDNNGHQVMAIGQLPDGTYGIEVYDNNGNVRSALGKLVNGDYGLQVIDSAGNSQEILPAVQQYVAANINVTSQTYVQDGGPVVSAVVGASGKVKVEASAFAAANAGNVGAWVGLYIDGAFAFDLTEIDSAGGQITTSFGSTIIVSGLTPGSTNTFELYYKWTSATGSANFQNRSLVVTPL